MKIFKDVISYMDDGYMDYYTKNESFLYQIAFFVLSVVFSISKGIVGLFLITTSPIWIVPYLIYLKIRDGKKPKDSGTYWDVIRDYMDCRFKENLEKLAEEKKKQEEKE